MNRISHRISIFVFCRQVGVLPSGMASPVEVSVPIILGTLPLHHVVPTGMTGIGTNEACEVYMGLNG